MEARIDRPVSSNTGVRLRLVNPFGEVVASGSDFPSRGYVVLTTIAREVGGYRVEVDGNSSTPVTLSVKIDPFVALARGSTVDGEVAGLGSEQRFTIELTQGESITIEVKAAPTSNLRPAITISDPFGGHAAGFSSIHGNMAGSHTAKYTGRYIIAIGDSDNSRVGPFSLSIR